MCSNNKTKNNKFQDDFLNQIKVNHKDVDRVIEKKKFLEELDGNIEALKMLSYDRLNILNEYYKEIIKKYEEEIRRLKFESQD